MAFFVRYRKKGAPKPIWGGRFDHIEYPSGRIVLDQGREHGRLGTRDRERAKEVERERRWEREELQRRREERRREREAMGMGMGGGGGPGHGRGRGGGGGHGGGHGGAPVGRGGGFVGHGGGPGGAPGGRGGGFVGHGGDPGGMGWPGAGPGGPPGGRGGGFVGHGGIQGGHGPGGGEGFIQGEEPRRPGGYGGADEDYASSDNDDEDSPAHSLNGDEADPILANGEFNPHHQFNVPPDNIPGGAHGNPAERRAAHNRGWRGTPEGWDPNAGGIAARMAWHGGSVYAGEYGGAQGGNTYPGGYGGAQGGNTYPGGYGGAQGGNTYPSRYGGAQGGGGNEREKKKNKKEKKKKKSHVQLAIVQTRRR